MANPISVPAPANGSADGNGSAKVGKVVVPRNRAGQFLKGHPGIGDRKLGSRNKLGEKFLADLEAIWRKRGKAALERVAVDDPAILVKVAASLMPKELIAQQTNLNFDVSLFADAKNFAEAFRLAKNYLGLSNADAPRMIEIEAEELIENDEADDDAASDQ
jgi:hypothetical protein